ncbi:MAG: tyrosine-type recombinase/integrase [Alistipes sp.]|nr:tyrosine-type recombinase/integrase [Alistipes sp.]
MATVYFSLSAKLIGGKKQVMVRFGGTGFNQRAKSGLYVNPTYWDDLTQGVTIPKPRLLTDELIATIKELREVDAKIRELRLFIEDEYIKDTSAPANNANWLKEVVYVAINGEEEVKDVDFWGAWELFISTKIVSSQRRKLYTTVRNILQRFERVKQRKTKGFALDLHTFPPILLSEFERYLYEEDKYAEKYPDIFKDVRLCEGRGGVKRGANTVSGRLDIFRTFYKWAVEKDLTTHDPFLKFHIKAPVYGTPIYITKEERDALLNHPMSTQSLTQVRDIFVFHCCIGCRAGDLLKFTRDNVIDGAIEYIAGKTADDRPLTVRVPLNSIASAIIEKYKDDKRRALLPFVSHQKYNDYIKKCFKEAGITRMVTVIDTKTGRNKQVRICDYVTTHMARKTFIGNLYSQVQDPNLIGALSGHREGSKAFARYRNIDEDLKRKTVELLE